MPRGDEAPLTPSSAGGLLACVRSERNTCYSPAHQTDLQGDIAVLYLIHCLDKAGSAGVRKDNLPAHVEYLKSKPIDIVMAGPMIGNDGESVIGSFLVVEAENRAEAEAFSTNDPYAKAGLFDNVLINAWKKTVG